MTDFSIDLGVVNSAVQTGFARRLRVLFEPALGRLPMLAGDRNVDQHFAILMHQAASEGFARRNLTVKYAFVATHLGLFFRFDPLFQQMRETALWQDGAVHPIIGLNRMFDHADLMIAEGLVNRNTGFVPGLIEAGDMPQTASPIEVISQAAPKRAKAFGPEALNLAFSAAAQDCAPGAAMADCSPRDTAIACHFLGYGFWLDPLYHWVPPVLAREGLKGLGDRLNG